MRKFFTAKQSQGKETFVSFPSGHREKSLFTPAFFKFLFGFSAMILAAFLIISFSQ